MDISKINELKKGDKIQGFFFIKDLSCKITNGSNNKFLDMTLMDKTGEINAKLWECNNEHEATFKENMLVNVRGSVIEWKGRLQIKLDAIKLISKEDDVDITEFVPIAPYAPEVMFEELLSYKEKIKNQDIKNIVEVILDEAGPSIMYYPAAKSNHHAIRSGLLYHITTMLKVAEKLCEIYTFVNSDLLYAGVILHDMAKIEEMNSSELGIVSEYSIEGQLLGHIVIGVRKIEMAADKVNADKEVSMLLQHMILTHHYEPEYGSPKKPMTPEAELLHHIDVMDARMYDMHKANKDIAKGTFSERIWSLNNLSVYNSNISTK